MQLFNLGDINHSDDGSALTKFVFKILLAGSSSYLNFKYASFSIPHSNDDSYKKTK